MKPPGRKVTFALNLGSATEHRQRGPFKDGIKLVEHKGRAYEIAR